MPSLMRLITWSHDPQAKTASIDPPRKMRPLPIWNQRVHSQKAFGVWLVKNSSSMFQDHQWCWGRQFDLESHGWDPRRWYPIRGRGIHATEAFLCFIGSVESLNDVFWRCPLYIYIHILQYNNYMHFLHKRPSDMKCPSSDSCWMALN